jgi:di/tripeptidase
MKAGRICATARSCMHAAEAQALVRESDELIAIVTTIIKNKRKNVSAKKAAEKAAKAAARRTASSPS